MNATSSIFLLLAVGFLPGLIGLGALYGYRRWHDRDGRSSPIANRRLHGPGEQLRKQIDNEYTELLASYSALIVVGPILLAAWGLTHVNWNEVLFRSFDLVYLALFFSTIIFALLRMIKHWKRIRRCTDGRNAELYTAQELNRLAGLGCTVLHDVPGDGFNLDHVVIGPSAVFLVETKAVRKPRKEQDQDSYKVRYDGSILRFPRHSNGKATKQAQRQADWLRAYLRESTSIDVPVFPTVALPGWWIDPPSKRPAVRVFNPAGRGANFMADTIGSKIDQRSSALLIQSLLMRYPVESEARKG